MIWAVIRRDPAPLEMYCVCDGSIVVMGEYGRRNIVDLGCSLVELGTGVHDFEGDFAGGGPGGHLEIDPLGRNIEQWG